MSPLDGFEQDYTNAPATTQEPSLEGLIAFCESKPADEVYNWDSPGCCAVGQYARSIGSGYSYVVDAIDIPHPHNWSGGRFGVGHLAHPHFGEQTFGALADRARSLLTARGE